jgi:hypothetical protein
MEQDNVPPLKTKPGGGRNALQKKNIFGDGFGNNTDQTINEDLSPRTVIKNKKNAEFSVPQAIKDGTLFSYSLDTFVDQMESMKEPLPPSPSAQSLNTRKIVSAKNKQQQQSHHKSEKEESIKTKSDSKNSRKNKKDRSLHSTSSEVEEEEEEEEDTEEIQRKRKRKDKKDKKVKKSIKKVDHSSSKMKERERTNNHNNKRKGSLNHHHNKKNKDKKKPSKNESSTSGSNSEDEEERPKNKKKKPSRKSHSKKRKFSASSSDEEEQQRERKKQKKVINKEEEDEEKNAKGLLESANIFSTKAETEEMFSKKKYAKARESLAQMQKEENFNLKLSYRKVTGNTNLGDLALYDRTTNPSTLTPLESILEEEKNENTKTLFIFQIPTSDAKTVKEIKSHLDTLYRNMYKTNHPEEKFPSNKTLNAMSYAQKMKELHSFNKKIGNFESFVIQKYTGQPPPSKSQEKEEEKTGISTEKKRKMSFMFLIHFKEGKLVWLAEQEDDSDITLCALPKGLNPINHNDMQKIDDFKRLLDKRPAIKGLFSDEFIKPSKKSTKQSPPTTVLNNNINNENNNNNKGNSLNVPLIIPSSSILSSIPSKNMSAVETQMASTSNSDDSDSLLESEYFSDDSTNNSSSPTKQIHSVESIWIDKTVTQTESVENLKLDAFCRDFEKLFNFLKTCINSSKYELDQNQQC